MNNETYQKPFHIDNTSILSRPVTATIDAQTCEKIFAMGAELDL